MPYYSYDKFRKHFVNSCANHPMKPQYKNPAKTQKVERQRVGLPASVVMYTCGKCNNYFVTKNVTRDTWQMIAKC